MAKKSAPGLFLTAFFGLQVFTTLGRLALGGVFLAQHQPNWRAFLMYGSGAAYIGY
jgi:hypothetical protein